MIPPGPPLAPPPWLASGGFMRKGVTLPCAPRWGGCLVPPGTPPLEPFAGRLVPFHAVSLLRSSHTARRGAAASDTNHPSRPLAVPTSPSGLGHRGGHLGRACRRKGAPHVRRGLGYVGAWPLARLTKSHRGYRPVGEAARGRTSWEGLLLGRLGGVLGPTGPLPPADCALGNSEGGSGCAARRSRPSARQSPPARLASRGPRPSN